MGALLRTTLSVRRTFIYAPALGCLDDFRNIQDAFMRKKDIDYFENSRRATYAQQQYAIDNPLKFEGYARKC
jgi:hypothetical protein